MAAERDAAPRRPQREPMVWLMVGLLAAAVVAGFVTLWLALSHPDPLVGPPPGPAGAPATHAPR